MQGSFKGYGCITLIFQFSQVAYQEILCRWRECCTDLASFHSLKMEAALVQIRAYCVCRVLCIVCVCVAVLVLCV